MKEERRREQMRQNLIDEGFDEKHNLFQHVLEGRLQGYSPMYCTHPKDKIRHYEPHLVCSQCGKDMGIT